MIRKPKFVVGESIYCEGVSPVYVISVLDDVPFDEPCYWVGDASGHWVCSESCLSREIERGC